MRPIILFALFFIPVLLWGQDQSVLISQRDSLLQLAIQAADDHDEDKAWALCLEASSLFDVEDFCNFKYVWEEVGYYYKDSDFYKKQHNSNFKYSEKYFLYPIELAKEKSNSLKNNNLECWNDLYVFLGQVYRDHGKIPQAKKAFEVAFFGYEKLEKTKFKFDKEWVVSYVYWPLANIYTRLEDYESAHSLLLLIQSELSKLGLKNLQAEAVTDYGTLLATMGKTKEAIKVYSKQLEYPELKLKTKSQILLGRASCFSNLQQFEAAMKDILKTISIAEKLERNSYILADAHLIKGKIETQNKTYDLAKKSLNNAHQYALQVFPERSRKIGKIYVSLGQLHLAMKGAEKEALIYFQKALFTILPGINTQELDEMPAEKTLYPENTILEALEGKAQTYRQIANQLGKKNHLILALKNLQLCFIEERLISTLQLHASSKVQFQNLNRKRREDALEICAQLYELTKEEQYAIQAFDIAEEGKASVLLAGVTEHLIRKKIGKDNTLLLQISQHEEALSTIEAQLLDMKKDSTAAKKVSILNESRVNISQNLRLLKDSFRLQYPYLNTFRNENFVNKAKKIRDSLLQNKQSVFVEYVLGDQFLYGFTIKKDQPIHFFNIPRDDAFNQTLLAFAENFSAENRWSIGPKHYQETAYDFYMKIVKPAGIEAYEEVIIIPDGMLSAIPFEALVRTKNEAPFFKHLDYLLQYQNIRYAYSGAVLLKQKQSLESVASFMMVAPDFSQNKWDLPPLDIGALDVNGFDSFELTNGANATKHYFVKNAHKYRFIHLFTHAEADKEGVVPKIYFMDSTLTLPEIYTLDLSAELVVLSACETNLGKLEKGEGVMSLSRGFAYAGVGSLISSLWKVKDQQTSQLFSSFYAGLQKDLKKSSALRQAKRDYLSETDDIHASPGYWAGFIFIGSENEVVHRPYWWWMIGGGFLCLLLILFLRKKMS